MTVPPQLERVLASELDAGELVQWTGQPIGGRAWVSSLPIFVFAIPWTAFSVFWMAGASHAGVCFMLFGLPFVAIGVAMLLSPLAAVRASRNTLYVITDRRALIIQHGMLRSVRSYSPATLDDIERQERADGSGHLLFGWENVPRSSDGSRPQRPGFKDVADVRHAERMLLAMIASHGRGAIEEARR